MTVAKIENNKHKILTNRENVSTIMKKINKPNTRLLTTPKKNQLQNRARMNGIKIIYFQRSTHTKNFIIRRIFYINIIWMAGMLLKAWWFGARLYKCRMAIAVW